MGDARTVCPECNSRRDVVVLADLLYSPGFAYYRCRGCGCWWKVPGGSEEPASRIVIGNPNSFVSSQKAKTG
jgi:hypothetical protein